MAAVNPFDPIHSILRARYWSSCSLWQEVTAQVTYQDGAEGYNELSNLAPRLFEIEFTGLTANEAMIFDNHHNEKKFSNSFSFLAKDGFTYSAVYYDEYEPFHDRHLGHIQNRRVRIRYNPGEGTVTDTGAPTIPQNPVANTVVAGGFTANWDASVDNVAVTDYEYRLNGGGWVSAGNVTTKAITGVSGNQYFEVRAKDAASNYSAASAQSNTVSVPADITTITELVHLYEAERETGYSEGAAATTFQDFEGSADGTTTGGAEAKWHASDTNINSKAYYDFTHADNSHYDISIPMGSSYTMLFVLKFNGVETVRNGLFKIDANNTSRFLITGAFQHLIGGTFYTTSDTDAENNWVVLELSSDGTDNLTYENKVLNHTVSGANWDSLTMTEFGLDGTYPLDSRLALYAHFTPQITGTDRDAAYDYLSVFGFSL